MPRHASSLGSLRSVPGPVRLHRAATGRADLLRLMLALDGEALIEAAKSLGFEHPAPDEAPALSAQSQVDAAVVHPPPASEQSTSAREPLTAVLYAVVEQRTAPVGNPLHEQMPPEAATIFEQPHYCERPVASASMPLLPKRRLAAFVRRCLRRAGPSQQLDVAACVQHIASGHALSRLPKRRLPGWHHGSALVLSDSPRMQALKHDVPPLIRLLLRASGGRAQVYWLSETGDCHKLMGLLRDGGQGRLNWQPVPPAHFLRMPHCLWVGTVEDTGQPHPGPELARAVLRGQGSHFTALLPQTDRPEGVSWPSGVRHATWDHGAHMRLRRPAGPQAWQGSYQPLLATLALAACAERPMLRALRVLLGLPVDAEHLVWQHPDVKQDGVACCIKADRLAHYFEMFRQGTGFPPGCAVDSLRLALAQQVLTHSLHLSPLVLMESAARADALVPGASAVLPSHLADAQTWWRRQARTLALAPGSEAARQQAEYMPGMVQRMRELARVWAHNRGLAEAWVRVNLRRGSSSSLLRPEGLPADVVLRVQGPAVDAWHVVQRGEALWLAPESTVPAGHTLGTLITHAAGDVVQISQGGVLHQVALPASGPSRVSDEGTSVLLTPHDALPGCKREGRRWRIHSALDDITVEALPRPAWALAWGRDAQGLYAMAPSPKGVLVRLEAGTTKANQSRHRYGTPGWVVESESFAWSMGADDIGLYADISVSSRHVHQRFRWIAPGSFWMGAPDDEPSRDGDDGPRHHVTLSEGFWLADTACTQALWRAVMAKETALKETAFLGLLQNRADPQTPVANVSWLSVQVFLAELQALVTGVHVALPTEAQWEYACRAGTDTPFSFGKNIAPDLVNYNGIPYRGVQEGWNRRSRLTVGRLPSNPWGLYEMHGNVWEWCADGRRLYSAEDVVDPLGPGLNPVRQSQDKPNAEREDGGGMRALRGGSWYDDACSARSASRYALHPGVVQSNIGFRIALRSPGPSRPFSQS